MSTTPEIIVNRANAAFSTGPLTPQGKATSSANALTHGLTARQLRLADHEAPIFEQLRADFESQFAPTGALEAEVFSQLLLAAWNLRRAASLHPLLDPLSSTDAAAFQRLELYQRRLERSFYKSLQELRTLQTERLAREAILINASSEPLPDAATAAMPAPDWPRVRALVLRDHESRQSIANAFVHRTLDRVMRASLSLNTSFEKTKPISPA